MSFRRMRTNAIRQVIQSSNSSPGLESQPKNHISSPLQEERQLAKPKRPRFSKSSTTSIINSDTHIQSAPGVRINTSRDKAPTTRSIGELRSQSTNDRPKFNFPPHLDPAYHKRFQKSTTPNSTKEVTPTSIEPIAAEISEGRPEEQCLSAHKNVPPPGFSNQQSPTDYATENVIEMEDDVFENTENVDTPLQQGTDQATVKKPKSFRSRNMKSKAVIPDGNGRSDYDKKEDILIIDAENNQKILSGTIQPIDIDGLDDGFRCIVLYNELNQPIHRGEILTRYLGWLAKVERFCPVGFESWHELTDEYKIDLIKRVRDKFVIPDGQTYDKTIFTRAAKSWRSYKFQLKKDYFHPDKKTKEQISNHIPEGVSIDNWRRLVNIWYSEKSQMLSSIGKKARKSKTFVHTTGSTSYANKRVDYIKSIGKEPSHLEFFELTHKKSEGGFVENTLSAQLMEEAKSKVQEMISNSSPSKSRTDIENEVFNEMMYEDAHPKRPIGYGCGVKQSQVFGVHSYLRKEEYKSTGTLNNSDELQVRMSGLEKQNQELRSLLLQTIQAVRTGNISDDAFTGIQSALSKPDSQVASVGRRVMDDDPPSSS